MNDVWSRIGSPHPRWRLPATIVLIVVTAGLLTVNAVLATPSRTPEAGDYPTFGPPGAAILTGHWGGVYADPIVQAGPFELIFYGIPNLLGISTDAQWIAFSIATSALAAVALAALTVWVIRPLIPVWAVPVAVAVAALASASGLTVGAMVAGHPAEIVIPLLWIVSAELARRGRPFAAGVVLGLTTGWELWGALGAPVLLLAPQLRARNLTRSGIGAVLVAVLPWVPFVVLGPFRMFAFAWFIYADTLPHLLFPGMAVFPWPLRLLQGALAVGSGVAVAVVLRRRRDAIWMVPLAICVVRLLMDPVLLAYYAVPPMMLIALGLALSIVQRRIAASVCCLVLYNVLVDFGKLTAFTSAALTAVALVLVIVLARSTEPESRGSFERSDVASDYDGGRGGD